MAPIRVEAAFRPSQAGAAILAKGGQRCVAAQKMNFKVPPRCEGMVSHWGFEGL
jgi:hypothetical protein